MSFRGRHVHALVLLAIGFAIGAITVGGAVAARYITHGDTEVTSIKLTGGGLPDLGAESTYGVAELPSTIRTYHDSGLYDQEIATVDTKAKQSLTNQLRRLRKSPGPGRYSECNRTRAQVPRGSSRRSCSTSTRPRSPTTRGSTPPTSARPASSPGPSPATTRSIAPTLELYRFARKKGVEAFFITGRPDVVRTPTETNLNAVGYDQGYTLTTKPAEAHSTIEYKSGERARIEEELGFTILVNVGDQDSDLAGGHARRAFKLPNPMYFIP